MKQDKLDNFKKQEGMNDINKHDDQCHLDDRFTININTNKLISKLRGVVKFQEWREKYETS